MTASDFRQGPGAPKKPRTLVGALAAAFLGASAELTPKIDDGTHWPSAVYRDDPEGFCRTALGVTPWYRQIEVLESIRDNLKTAVRSGNKCGKTTLAAIAALWFYSSFPDARVWMTAATARTINQAIWREIRKMHAGALIPLDGEPAQHCGTGLTAPDLRQIVGFTAASKEDAAGISGANMLYIIDEASGVADEIYEGIEGNRAGGQVRVLLISNPTKTEGEFYQAFTSKAAFYNGITISGEETPNCTGDGPPIPGLASPEWIEEKAREYGRESVFFRQRVLGLHTEGEEGKIYSLEDITSAQLRWADAEAKGPLVVGLDPAGSGVGGDEIVFCPRRGAKVIDLYAHRSLTAAGILTHLQGYLDRLLLTPSEIAMVVLDCEGSVGAEVFGVLRAAAGEARARFRVAGVRAGQRATRNPMVYEMTRDELWAAGEQWIKRELGAIPEHAKLLQDLHAPSWEASVRNRQKATSKEEIKQILGGRSPDYGDALNLSCWFRGDELIEKPPPARDVKEARHEAAPYPDKVMDPYAGVR
jgi:phage terminase large subunit